MAYTIKSGSMSFPQSIKDLAEYLSVNCNSTLEVHYTQGKDANTYAKEMFNEYKTSQKYKSTYKSTIPMDMIIRDLESKEKTNGNKPLTVGSDLYKVFIDQATKTMRQYVEYFPKVYSGYILEITVSTCNYKDKLKSTLDDLMKKGAVKKVFYQDKITYLHCADSYAIGRILKDIQAKEVKTPVVAKPTTTTPTTNNTSSSSFQPCVKTSHLNNEDKKAYIKFQRSIDKFLNFVSSKYERCIKITDITRNKQEQAYFMLGSMNPTKNYTGTRYELGEFNYITIYDASIIKEIIKYGFTRFSSQLEEFEKYQDYFIKTLFKDAFSKDKTSEYWKTKEGEKAQEFFSALAHTIIGSRKLTRENIKDNNSTSKNFRDFADWVNEQDFKHLDSLSANKTVTAVDFVIENLDKTLTQIEAELNNIPNIKRDYNLVADKKIVVEDTHIHVVLKQ